MISDCMVTERGYVRLSKQHLAPPSGPSASAWSRSRADDPGTANAMLESADPKSLF
jgi:hypothetical protein